MDVCRLLIAVVLSIYILMEVFDGAAIRRERIASSSMRVVSGYDCVAALNFINVLSLQIHPIPDWIVGVWRFLRDPSV
jgi:hypothetical protein